MEKAEEGVVLCAVAASVVKNQVVRFRRSGSTPSHGFSCSHAPSSPMHHPIAFFSRPRDRHPTTSRFAMRPSLHVRIGIYLTCIDMCCFHSTSLEGHVGSCLQIHLVVNVGAKRGERGERRSAVHAQPVPMSRDSIRQIPSIRTDRVEEFHVAAPPRALFFCSLFVRETSHVSGNAGPVAKRVQGGTKSSNGTTTADSRHSSRPTTHTCGERPDEQVQTRPRARSSSQRHDLSVLWKKRTSEKNRTRTTNVTDANCRGRLTILPRARRPLTKLLQEDRNVDVLSTTVEKDLLRFVRVYLRSLFQRFRQSQNPIDCEDNGGAYARHISKFQMDHSFQSICKDAKEQDTGG